MHKTHLYGIKIEDEYSAEVVGRGQPLTIGTHYHFHNSDGIYTTNRLFILACGQFV
jgi:hypothetical protein